MRINISEKELSDDDCFLLQPSKDPVAIDALKTYAHFTKNERLAREILMWIHQIRMRNEEKIKGYELVYGTNIRTWLSDEELLNDELMKSWQQSSTAGRLKASVALENALEKLKSVCVDRLNDDIDKIVTLLNLRKRDDTR